MEAYKPDENNSENKFMLLNKCLLDHHDKSSVTENKFYDAI
jgi:hypothetical protein